MKNKKLFLTIVLFCSVVLGLTSCDKQASPEGVIAEVGEEKIYREDFDISFFLNPQYAIRTPMKKARQSQIIFLVNQKFYVLAARESNLEQDPLIQNHLNYIEAREIIRFYIQKKFLDQITIDDQEILEAYARLGTKVRVQHLFTESPEGADSLYARISRGETFESIAQQIYRDSTLRESGGDLGYIGFGDMDPQLEERVYSMSPGEISQPVQSAYGYHILKVLDFQQNVQFQETPEPVKIKTIKEILQTRAADKQIRAHLNDLAGNRKIQVSNRILDVLVTETMNVMGNRYDEVNLFQPPIYTGDLNRIELRLQDILDEILITFGEETMTVEDFLDRLRQMPPLHRPYLKTRSRMTQAMIDMIRNDLILQEARKQNLQKDPEVRESIQKITEELLADEFQKRLYGENFKKGSPDQWKRISDIYENVKTETDTAVYYLKLYEDLPVSDSLMAPNPIQLFIKNRYVW